MAGDSHTIALVAENPAAGRRGPAALCSRSERPSNVGVGALQGMRSEEWLTAGSLPRANIGLPFPLCRVFSGSPRRAAERLRRCFSKGILVGCRETTEFIEPAHRRRPRNTEGCRLTVAQHDVDLS